MELAKNKVNSTDQAKGTIRRLIRQQSITRGTASSIAKMVRPTKTPAVLIPDQKKNLYKTKAPSTDDVDPNNLPFANRCFKHKQVETPSDSSIENSSDIAGSEAPFFDSLISSSSSSSSQEEDEMIPRPNSHFITLKLSESTHSTKSIKPNANTPETPSNITKHSVESITQNDSCCYETITPHYMSRPICGACNRNVKVTSSSERVQRTGSVKRSQYSISSDRELPTPTSSPRPYSPSSPTPKKNQMIIPDEEETGDDDDNNNVQYINNHFDHNNEEKDKDKENENENENDKPPRKEESRIVNFDKVNSIRDIVSISKKQINDILKADNINLAKNILKHQLELMDKLERMEPLQLSTSTPNLTTGSTVMPVIMMNVSATSAIPGLSYHLHNELDKPSQGWDKTMTRMKWSLGNMVGTMAGTGEIKDLDFDDYGYPKHVVISGTCITAEHKLLPKRLQKYHNHKYNLACYSYAIEMTRQRRLQEFQLISESEWIPDNMISCCEFLIPSDRPQRCTVKFGLLNRKHHCRSCGHIFCQQHSANRLALFDSRGTECGEWARVCDTCFYSKVGPFLKRH